MPAILNQPADDLAFERIINVPRRGIGDGALKTMHEAARDRKACRSTRGRAWAWHRPAC